MSDQGLGPSCRAVSHLVYLHQISLTYTQSFWTDNIFCLIYNRFDLDSCRSSDYVAQCIPDSGGGEILASWCKQTLDEAMDQSASDRQYIEATILLSLLVGPDELLSSVRHDLKAGQV
jgi:hypothetical protein